MWSKIVLLIVCIRTTICGVLVQPTDGDTADWWQTSVIYEIFPLSFKDSDDDGSGDFKGIIQNLDYLVDIGVTAIWLTPFLESPLESGGYDISNYLNVQKVFGTMGNFKTLVNAVHDKNLKFIMDFVPNHTSDKHDWFKSSVNVSSKYADYYIWRDAKNQEEVMKNSSITPIEPNNWKQISGEDPAWHWHDTRKQFYFAQFSTNLPDLNFRNQNIHDEMKNILNYWLELGVDGIRIDALRHVYENQEMKDEPIIDESKPASWFNMDHIYTVDQNEVYDLIKEWRSILDTFSQKPGTTRIMMTESYSPLNVLFEYYKIGAQIPSNFKLIDSNHYYTAEDYNREIKNWITNMPEGATYNVVLQNHDQKRISTSYGAEFIDSMNALSLFLPGVAIVYYGGEIGMEDISDSVNFARSPMQWNSLKFAGFTNNNKRGPWIEVHPNYETRNVLTETNESKSYLNFFKSVMRLRKTDTLKRGGLATYIYEKNVFVLNRFLPRNENYTLVINMDSHSQDIRISDQMHDYTGCNLTVVIGSGNTNFDSGDSVSAESLTISPGAAVILTDG